MRAGRKNKEVLEGKAYADYLDDASRGMDTRIRAGAVEAGISTIE